MFTRMTCLIALAVCFFSVGVCASTAIVIKASASKGGAIEPSGRITVSVGDTKTFSIAPIAGYYIKDVKVDGKSEGAITTRTFTDITKSHSIAASFALNPIITVTATSGGTITPSGKVSVPYGADQTFTITPDTGYAVADVKVDGKSEGAISSKTLTNVTVKHSLAVKFAASTTTPVEYPIQLIVGAHGSVSPMITTAKQGTKNLKFTITPDKDYEIADVKLNDVSKGAVSLLIIETVTGPIKIEVLFKSTKASVTISGMVTMQDGMPVAGAEVSVGDVKVFTDSSGIYTMSVTPIAESIVVHTTATSDFAPQISNIKFKQNTLNYALPIRLLKLKSYKFNAADGATFQVGATFTIPPNAVTGPDPHYFHYISYPVNRGPGTMELDDTSSLQSSGMYYINIVDANGAISPLNSGATITITQPAFTPSPLNDSDVYKGWKLNTVTGLWGQPTDIGTPESGLTMAITGKESQSLNIGTPEGVLKMPATDYGYTNCDRSFKNACIKGTLKSENGNCAGGRIRADGTGLSNTTNSGPNGEFCITSAQGQPITLQIGATSAYLSMPSQPGNCSSPESCKDIGVIQVSANECEGKVVDTCFNTGGTSDNPFANSTVIFALSPNDKFCNYNSSYLETSNLKFDVSGNCITGLTTGFLSCSGSISNSGQINIKGTVLASATPATWYEYQITGQATPNCKKIDYGKYAERTFGIDMNYTKNTLDKYGKITATCSGAMNSATKWNASISAE